MPLTDTAVRNAKAQEKDYSLNDMDGLSLFVSAKGTKSWHFRFSWHGKQPRISLGTYPELSLRDAREARDKARSLVAKGIDPRLQRRAERHEAGRSAESTFAAVAERWQEFRNPRLTAGRQGSVAQSRRYLDKDLIPALGKLPISDITRADVLGAVRRIEQRGALDVAKKCRTWLNQIFRFAIAEGLTESNPASDLDIMAAPAPAPQHNPHLKLNELPELLRALRAYSGSSITASGVRLLLLTMVRTQELRFAERKQFDLGEALWSIPPEVVKQLQGKAKEDRNMPDYLVPLSRQAVEEVRKLLAIGGNYRLLLPGRNDPNTPISENTLNTALKRMGYEGRLTGHGIRGTISTALHEAGFKSEWIEAQLGHADPNKVRGAYNHAEYLEQRREMMQWWADKLDELERQAS